MSEFKRTKSYEDLVNENKEMLEMLKECLNSEYVTGKVLKEQIKQLIKQVREI